MKFYGSKGAPNPRRVLIFLAEKGVEVPVEEVSIMKGEHKTPEYRKISPLAQVPALVLDNGEAITESIAICRYFEMIHPEPALFGADPIEITKIEMWQRRFEMLLFSQVAMHFRHCHPAMAELEQQNHDWGKLNHTRALKVMSFIDNALEDREFITDHYSIADITALVSLDFAAATRTPIPEECANLAAYHKRLAQRPSAQAGV